MKKLLETASDFVFRFYRWLLIFAFILTVISIFFISKLRYDPDLMTLMPQKSPSVLQLKKIYTEFGSKQVVILAVKGEREKEINSFCEKLSRALKKLPMVYRIFYRIDLDYFKRNAPLFLTTEYLKETRKILKEDRFRIRSFLKKPDIMQNILISIKSSSRIRNINELNPMKLNRDLRIMNNIVNSFHKALKYNYSTEDLIRNFLFEKRYNILFTEKYLMSKNRKMQLIMIFPKAEVKEKKLNVEFVSSIKETVDTLENSSKFEIGLTGLPVIEYEEKKKLSFNLIYTSIIALSIVLIMFTFFFKMKSSPLLIGMPLLIGLVWEFMIIKIVFNHINLFTSSSIAIIIGLGVDFMIHIMNRYTTERARGIEPQQALRDTIVKSGRGIVTGGISTSTVFFILMLGKFKGMIELGFIVGTSILLFLFISILIFPSILLFRDKHLSNRSAKILKVKFLVVFENFILKKPAITAVLLLVLLIFFLFKSLSIEFEHDISKLDKRNEAVNLKNEINEQFKFSTDYAMIISKNVNKCSNIYHMLKEKDSVSRVDSIMAFIPENQKKKIRIIEEMNSLISNNDLIGLDDKIRIASDGKFALFLYELSNLADFLKQMREIFYMIGYKDNSYLCITTANKIKKLREYMLNNKRKSRRKIFLFEKDFKNSIDFYLRNMGKINSANMITFKTLPRSIKRIYMSRHGEFLTTVYPDGNIWNKSFINDLNSIDENFTSTHILYSQMVDFVFRELARAILYAFIAIFIILLLDFKEIRSVFFVLFPLIFAMAMLLGTLSLLRIKLSIINISSLSIIIGIGIDNAIHILHTYRDKRNIAEVFRTIGRALILTAITTIAGFGSLMFSSHTGIADLGITMALGMFYCLFTTTTLLPVLIKLFPGKRYVKQ